MYPFSHTSINLSKESICQSSRHLQNYTYYTDYDVWASQGLLSSSLQSVRYLGSMTWM